MVMGVREAKRPSAQWYGSSEPFRIGISETKADLGILFPELKGVDVVEISCPRNGEEARFTIRPGFLKEAPVDLGINTRLVRPKIEYVGGYEIKVTEGSDGIPIATMSRESVQGKEASPIVVHGAEVYKEAVYAQDSQLKVLEYITETMKYAAVIRKQLATNEISGKGELNDKAVSRILNVLGLLDQVILLVKDAEIAEGTGRIENLLLLRTDESPAEAKARPWRPNHQVVL